MTKVVPGSVVVGFLDDHHWSACFGLSLRDMYLRDATVGLGRMVRENGRELRKVAGTGGLPEGRNEVARDFLDTTDGEWLFFIDADMGFAPDTVDRLVDSADPHRRPVMGGLCFAQRKIATGPFHSARFGVIPTIYDFLETEDEVGFSPRPSYDKDSVIRAAGTGAACLLIHRRALLKIRKASGDTWFNTITHPTGLRGGPRTFSEDLSFCVRLAQCDLPLHINTGVRTVHEKGGVFLEEALFDMQQAAAAAEAAEVPSAVSAA